MSCRILQIALAVAVLSCTSPVGAANILEEKFLLSGPRYDREIPPCNYASAIERITDRVRADEHRFWNSELRIIGCEDIRENAALS